MGVRISVVLLTYVLPILAKLISYLKWRSASVSELILTSSDPDGLRCRFELQHMRDEAVAANLMMMMITIIY